MKKRILSFLLTAIMILTIMPVKARAAEPTPDYFYVTNTGSSSCGIAWKKKNSDAPSVTFQYSTDKASWTDVSALESSSLEGNYISLGAGETIYFKGNYPGANFVNDAAIHYVCLACDNNDASLSVGGDITTLANPTGNITTLTNVAAFYGLFYNLKALRDASNLKLLPETLSKYCYGAMFSYCSNLTSAPQLPAMNLAESCYRSMFSSCGSLTGSIFLPATELKPNCYFQLLLQCTQITDVTMLGTGPFDDSTVFYNWLLSITTPKTLTMAACLEDGVYSSLLPSGWTLKKVVTVSFDTNGHGQKVSPQYIEPSNTVTEPSPAPSEEGYTFEGWYKDTAYENAWNFTTDLAVKDNITLHAKWTSTLTPPGPGPDPEPQGNYLDPLDDMFEVAINSGSTDTIYWDEGDALPNYIMKLLYENPSLSLDFKYTYEGVEHEIYIGPGQATNDDIEWYGPLWLLDKYGEKKDIPAIHGIYTIVKDDTLNMLSARFNTTVEELMRLNPYIKDSHWIYPGNPLVY